jgi:hypothetical protein
MVCFAARTASGPFAAIRSVIDDRPPQSDDPRKSRTPSVAGHQAPFDLLMPEPRVRPARRMDVRAMVATAAAISAFASSRRHLFVLRIAAYSLKICRIFDRRHA